jgi:hypothetical protein
VIPAKVDVGYLTWTDASTPDSDYVTTSITPMPLVSAGVSPNPIQDGQSQTATFLAAPNVSPGQGFAEPSEGIKLMERSTCAASDPKGSYIGAPESTIVHTVS